MSSGWNGIPIRAVGKTRHRLAELLSKITGWIVEAHSIKRTNPNVQHYEDCCAWDCYATIPGVSFKGHIYSWDRMKDCVKYGVARVNDPSEEKYDIEVCANEKK